MKTLSISIIALFTVITVAAQKQIRSTVLNENIKIDGNLNESIWEQQLVVGNFKQITPNNGKPASQQTKIALANDEAYLYVAAELFIKPEHKINTQLTTRDDTGASDYFGVILDPFGANREGWAFITTAANVQVDIKVTNNDNYDEWNAVWESAVKVYGDKWTVEFKIPFNSLRFPKGDLSNFRINFERFDSATNENSFWNYINADIDGVLNQFGKLEGLEGINPPINLSFFPFISLVNEHSPEGDSKTSFNGGLDLKYVYKNAYTLDVSLIPDFSQAPSDDQVFNLSPFEIRFDENRQFFVEGTEIFDKGGYLYTRNIGGEPINKDNIEISEAETIIENPVSSNIVNLIKFTGKSEKGLAIGVLNGVTSKSEATIINETTGETRTAETNPLTNYNAIVLDQTLKNNSSVTLINNSVLRSGSVYDANLTAALLRLYDKNRSYNLSLKKAVSQKYFSNSKNEFGHHYQAAVSKISGQWRGLLLASLKDENYDNNDFGFNPRNNSLTYYGSLSYVKSKAKNLFAYYKIDVNHFQRYYYSLKAKERSFYELQFFGRRPNNHNIFVELTYQNKGQDFFEARVKDRAFKEPAFVEVLLEYQTNRNKNISFAGYVTYAKYFNSYVFKEAASTGFALRSRIGEHLALELEGDLDYLPNDAGFLTIANDDILFGQRKVKQLTNNLNIDYALNSKFSLTANIRHYWIQVDYDKQFTLAKSGDLIANNYDIDLNEVNANFNAFNIDFFAQWQLAPASELSLGYKLGATYFDRDINSSYGRNFETTLNERKSHTLSLKLTCLVDFNSLKSKRKKLKSS